MIVASSVVTLAAVIPENSMAPQCAAAGAVVFAILLQTCRRRHLSPQAGRGLETAAAALLEAQ
jgi:hypothetical protein